MGIIIREADLPADRDILLDTLLRNRDHGDNALREARFEWSLSRNPYGRPRAWFAIDESSDKIIGSVSAFPRRVLVNGEPVLCWNGGDTSIDKPFRTLGVAIKLRRAVKECVDRGEMKFLYSHPVENMRVVLEKVGHVVIGKLARHGLVVRLDRFLDERMGRNPLASAISTAASPLLRLWWGNFCFRKDLAVRVQPQNHFNSEYDELFARVAKNHAVITVRDAQFLSWRFSENPLHKELHVLRLEIAGRLRGFAVIDFQNNGSRMLDFLLDDLAANTQASLAGILRWLRSKRISSFSVRASDNNIILRLLRSFGPVFCDTTNSAIAVHAPANSPVLDERNWFMTQADRDV
jgi:hypothetical protein